MDEWGEEAAKFRKNRRPIWIAVGLNTLLALIFLGGPYVLGQWRSAQSRHAFARFAACLWGGQPAPSPGLGLPPGESLYFADRMIHGPPRWPAHCAEPLRQVNRGSALLLFPSVEQAEGIVHEAVARVERQLAGVAERRTRSGPPPHVPLELHAAVERLMATLSYRSRVAGEVATLTDPAIRFAEEPQIVKPTRIPLRTSRDAQLHMRARGDGLVATSVGERGIAHVRVGGGGLTMQRVRRPALARGPIAGPGERPWLLWAMPEARCTDDPTRCAGHASGVARLERDHTRAPDPRWLAGHPHVEGARGTRAHATGDGKLVVDMITRRVKGGAEVRRFVLGRSEDGGDDGDGDGDEDGPPPPLAPAATWPLEGHADPDPALLLGTGSPRATWIVREGGEVVLRARVLDDSSRSAVPVDRVRLPAGADGPASLATCEAGSVAWVLVRIGDGARLLRFAGDEARAMEPVQAGGDPHLACANDSAALATRSARRRIAVGTCTVDGGCADPVHVDATARTFALARDRDVTALALGAGDDAHVRVTVWKDGADPPVPRVVAPCFGEEGGMCGSPSLAARNGRIVLGARERSDLLTVETTDAGRSWRPMRGLR